MLLEFGAELLDHSFAILEEFFLPIFISPSERSRRRVVLRSFQTWMQVDQCERVPWKAFHGFAQTLFQISAASSFSPMAFKRPYLLPKNTWLPTIQMEFQFCHIMFWGYQYRMVVENLCRAWLAILRNPIAVIGFWKLVFATTIGYAAECSQSPTKGTRGALGRQDGCLTGSRGEWMGGTRGYIIPINRQCLKNGCRSQACVTRYVSLTVH